MPTTETANMLLSTETLMTCSIFIFLVMSLIIWLKLKSMSTYHDMIVVSCPSCKKTLDVAYNSIGHEVECPDCGQKFHAHPDE